MEQLISIKEPQMNSERDTYIANASSRKNFKITKIETQSKNSFEKNTEMLKVNTDKRVKKSTNPWGIFVLVSTFLLMLCATGLFFYLENDFSDFRTERMNSSWGYPFLIIATALIVFKACFFIYTLYRYFCYKPIDSVTDAELPTCTVIVPAYNEGKQVWETLMSLANSDYPEAKLQLLAIDARS
jgi:hyaluronan synthase